MGISMGNALQFGQCSLPVRRPIADEYRLWISLWGVFRQFCMKLFRTSQPDSQGGMR